MEGFKGSGACRRCLRSGECSVDNCHEVPLDYRARLTKTKISFPGLWLLM